MSTLTAPSTGKIPDVFRHHPLAPLSGPYAVADWVAFEKTTNRKHELHNGVYVEMAGGSSEHNAISYELGRVLGNVLEVAEAPCVVFGSDQKVYITESRGYYPDVLVVCGEAQIDHVEVLRNPTAIIEVLSDSTAEFDRNQKFEDYKTIESLRHFILVEQYRPYIQHFALRDSGEWAIAGEYGDLSDSLRLSFGGVEVALPLAKIYRRVPFPAPTNAVDSVP